MTGLINPIRDMICISRVSRSPAGRVGRVRRYSKPHGWVRPGRVVSFLNLTGRVGSGRVRRFEISRTGSGRISFFFQMLRVGVGSGDPTPLDPI